MTLAMQTKTGASDETPFLMGLMDQVGIENDMKPRRKNYKREKTMRIRMAFLVQTKEKLFPPLFISPKILSTHKRTQK